MAKKKKPTSKRSSRMRRPSLREIYARVKREFTAADLQKYTVDEPMVPFDTVIAEMEAQQKHLERKKA